MKEYIKSLVIRIKRIISSNGQSKAIKYLKKYFDKDEIEVLVDVGAHHGLFVKSIAKNFKLKKAYLIEPIKGNYDILMSSFKQSGYEIVNAVISNLNNRKIEFNINNYDETSSILNIRKDIEELSNIDTSLNKKILIDSKTLDDIRNEYNINEISLLKIDVQGCEDLVLKGATETLKHTKFIWVETSFKPLYENAALFGDIYSIMLDNNFILLEISPGYRSDTQELLQADLLFFNKASNTIK
jgi:FkbM family methyltransferase